jgi:hypothetical protein|tara:strand:+ start:1655 stop:2041 length:387 start_codon:yes stop_codon:yes gene_type:complete
MEFFVRQHSNEPILKMQLIQDGRNDFDSFYQKLVNSAITFSMKDTKNGAFVILNRAAGVVAKTRIDPSMPVEYYIYYRWQPGDVSDVGRYQGQFNITLVEECSELIVPVREDLYINVTESFVNSSCDC